METENSPKKYVKRLVKKVVVYDFE